MSSKMEKAAAVIGRQTDVVEKLDSLMNCPNDRAYIVCSFLDCVHNVTGECTIFTVLDPVARAEDQPCSKYVRVM